MSTVDQHDIPTSEQSARLRFRRKEEVLVLELAGDWMLRSNLPTVEPVTRELTRGNAVKRMEFDGAAMASWDSGLVNFILNCHELCDQQHIEFAGDNLPDGVRKLMRLALAVPEARDAKRATAKSPPFARLGELGLRLWSSGLELAEFIGASALAFLALLRGTAQFRWRDTTVIMQRSGPEALGIVALISFLVGVILAFVGAVQLSRFGAAVFVADLVAIGTVREMGCLMTGVIVCGRTGAAFAAELGAMKVNEEISAFKAFGIAPMEFLVLPRMLGLFLMMPLLCVFADAIMISGGFVVCVSMLDVTATEYIRRTLEAITLQSFLLGIFKGAVFGMIVAGFGCLRGMQSRNDAAGVGQATTSAVVSGITAIVVADGLFAVLCDALGI